jgi:hypothetical protein
MTGDNRDCVDFMRDPQNGFPSMLVSRFGTEYSLRT